MYSLKKEIEVEELLNDFHEKHEKKNKKLKILFDNFLIEEKDVSETDLNLTNIIPKKKKKLIVKVVNKKFKGKKGLF
jgi:hypothetical protein